MGARHDRIRLRDSGLCVYCGDIGQHLDHVFPRKHGGKWKKGANIVLACTVCNMKKLGRLDIPMMTKAFHHLLSVGESLDWIDKLLEGLPEVSKAYNDVIASRLPPPPPLPIVELEPIYVHGLYDKQRERKIKCVSSLRDRAAELDRLISEYELVTNRAKELEEAIDEIASAILLIR